MKALERIANALRWMQKIDFFYKNQQLSNEEDNGVIEKDSKGARKDNVGFRVDNNMSKNNNNNNIFCNI